MADQKKKEPEVVLTLEEKKAKLVDLKAEVFDIMGEQEDLHRKMNGLQKKKMEKLEKINKLRAEVKKEEDGTVEETKE
jgi:hypothetical protein